MPASTLRTYRNGETGNINVIVWPSILEKQRRQALSAAPVARPDAG
jgi:hypothetical protein